MIVFWDINEGIIISRSQIKVISEILTKRKNTQKHKQQLLDAEIDKLRK